MRMKGVLRPGAGRIAKIKVRVLVNNVPDAETQASVTDIMFQPGQSNSEWMPHVYELPWTGGVNGP